MKMIEVRYMTDTGQEVIDYMPSKDPEKTVRKLNKLFRDPVIKLGAVKIETAGLLTVTTKMHEVH